MRIRKMPLLISTDSFTDDTIPPSSWESVCIYTSTPNCTQTMFWIWVCWGFFSFFGKERRQGILLCSSLARQTSTGENPWAGRGRWFSDPWLKSFCLRAKSSSARGLKARKQNFLSNIWGSQSRRCPESHFLHQDHCIKKSIKSLWGREQNSK